MFKDWLKGVLVRDVKALKRELEAFGDEADIWDAPPGTTNSAGNLTLHLIGNLRHFIGMQLGGNDYKRDRDSEFASRNVPRAELLRGLDAAIGDIERTLPAMSDADLEKPYGLKIGETTVTTGDFLLHIASHLGYHLGQVDYHRRIVTGEAGKIGAVMPTELATARK
jgi:uncharacterized damage-inducible protein DinB